MMKMTLGRKRCKFKIQRIAAPMRHDSRICLQLHSYQYISTRQEMQWHVTICRMSGVKHKPHGGTSVSAAIDDKHLTVEIMTHCPAGCG